MQITSGSWNMKKTMFLEKENYADVIKSNWIRLKSVPIWVNATLFMSTACGQVNYEAQRNSNCRAHNIMNSLIAMSGWNHQNINQKLTCDYKSLRCYNLNSDKGDTFRLKSLSPISIANTKCCTLYPSNN